MWRLLALLFLLALPAQAQAVPSYSDKALVATDVTFQNRVKEAMANACINISNEGYTIPNHKKRADFCSLVLFTPDSYKVIFAVTVATDTNVINDATQNGTVVLSTANAAAQAALVTDGHIDTAISTEFNAFLILP